MKGEPQIAVMCDVCEEEELFGMTALARNSWDCRDLDHQLQREGWLLEGDDRHVCPDCAEIAKEDPA